MFRKSLKYLIVVLANFIVLLSLILVWFDDFEAEFNGGGFFLEIIDLIALSSICVLVLFFLAIFFTYIKINSKKRKVLIAILIVLLTSCYFYIDYGKKIYNHCFVNKELRAQVIQKVKPYQGSWFGNIAENLTEKEYHEITKIKWFPTIPKGAENISYNYEYEGFLPDYSFSLSYDLPISTKVDTMHYKDHNFSKRRTFEIVNNKKRVTYYEGQW